MQASIISGYRHIPPYIRRFLFKVLVLLVAWKLIYLLILQPAGVPDHQLKQLTGSAAAKILSLFYTSVTTADDGYKYVISVNGRHILGIAPACTAQELIALYTGILLCLPRRLKKLVAFIIFGTLVIICINAIRCALLAWISLEHYPLFGFAHKWLFNLAIYFAAFYGWTLYLKGYVRTSDSPD
jgi:exosortase/archaeosortase family protein